MLKIALLSCLAATLVVCDESLFSHNIDQLYDEQQIFDQLFGHLRYRRQAEDGGEGNGGGDGPEIFEDEPPPPPPSGEGGPPEGGPPGGGPPEGGPPGGGPPPHHGGPGGPGHRRGPGGRFKPPRCCKMPSIEKEKVKAAFKSCRQSTPKPEHPKKRGCWKKPDGCFKECMFEELGLLKDGKVDQELVKNMIIPAMEKAETNAEELKTMMENAISACITNATQEAESNKCKSGAQELVWCGMKEIMLTCPEGSWEDSDMCNSMRERIKEGPPKDRKGKFPPCDETETNEAA
ncbi:uncharacterized protein [Anabrus simplex]|uniref:uncharacterized protein n=1 Tax=Anabrus simplex TaxID=316456 RepID=UPI0035A39D20